MSSSANVKSLERLEGFLEHCQWTRAHLLKELDNLQVEVQRLTNWLENEAQRYWSGELQQAQRAWVDAEQALLRCRSVVRESERRPCTEQIKRLEIASERRSLCERQVRFVRDATQMWQQEVTKLQSKIFRCRDLAEAELAVAVNLLKEQLARLDEYSRIRSDAVASLKTDPVDSSATAPTEAHDTPARIEQNNESGDASS